MRRQEPVEAFLRRTLLQAADAVDAAAGRVPRARDADAVHDLRVGLRRLRVLLRLGRPVFGRAAVDAARSAYATLQDATGALRDREALQETMRGMPVGFHAVRAREGEAALRQALVALCRTGALVRARAALEAALARPPKPTGALRRWARKCVAHARKRVVRQLKKRRSGSKSLHRLRLGFKRLRYTVELLGEALPARLRVLAERAAQAQKSLGEIHDLDVARAQAGDPDLFAHGSRCRAALGRARRQKARCFAHSEAVLSASS